MNAIDDDHALTVRNISLDSESQFSIFYLQYNLYSFDKWTNGTSLENSTQFTVTNTDHLVKFLLQGVGLSLITGLGTIGNVCSIIVLLNRRMRSSISCFLVGLAICDIMILAVSFITLGLPTLLSFEPRYPGLTSVYLIIGYTVPFTYGLSTTGLTGSVYFTVAITVERYLVVCHPLISRRICTWKRACQASAAIFVISILYNLPRWFHFVCDTMYDDNGNSIGCLLKATNWRKNQTYHYYYVFLAYGIVHYYIPACVLIVCNLLIYLKIREANKNRRSLSISDADNSLTYMLFIVVAVFIACNLMVGVGVIYKLVTWDKPLTPSPIGGAVGIFLLVLNSSLNFIIYCIYGERFREVFVDLTAQLWRRLTRSRQRSDSDFSFGSKSSVAKTSKNVNITSIQTICHNV